MKVAIATVRVPFITGGAETLARLLCEQLTRRGHQADVLSMPFKWYPPETLASAMAMGRMIDLTEVNGERIDVVIPVKFPVYYLQHPRKVVWLCHQHRQAYDLWGTSFSDLHLHPQGEAVRQLIMNSDRLALDEARAVYTISKNTADRLKRFNGIDATPLYHPPADFDRLSCESYDNFIFFPSRIERIKRQHLLVEAAARLHTPTRILLAGAGNARDVASVRELIARLGLEDRVTLLGHVSEEEKRRLYANCLAVYFGAYDEDYGYVTLEGLYSRKPVIIHPDAGGPTEFVVDGETGVVVPPDPGPLAHAIDELAAAPARARALGDRGFASLADKRIDWDEVIGRLLSHADV